MINDSFLVAWNDLDTSMNYNDGERSSDEMSEYAMEPLKLVSLSDVEEEDEPPRVEPKAPEQSRLPIHIYYQL